jgi:hypothetical protein
MARVKGKAQKVINLGTYGWKQVIKPPMLARVVQQNGSETTDHFASGLCFLTCLK